MALPPSTRKIPIIGEDIYKIGQIYDIINTPCSIDPWLWVYGFWHEVPMIFAMLFLPDPIDTVQDRFGRPHHRKRKYRGKAQSYRPADINPGKGLGWAAWKMTEWVDRVGWYLLVADVSINFAFNWTSTVYKWAGCPLPGTAYAAQSREYGLERFPGDWTEAGSEADGNHIFRNAGMSRIVVPAGWDASFTCGTTIVPRGPPYNGRSYEARIQNLTTGEAYPLDKPKVNNEGQIVQSGIWRTPHKHDTDMVYQYQIKNTSDQFIWQTKVVFSGYGSKKIEGLIPWLGEVNL